MEKGLALLLMSACMSAFCLDWELPVTTVKYEVGQGSSEEIEEEGLQPDSLRSTFSLKVKEDAKPASFGLGFAYSAKEYLEKTGDYRYVSLDQDARVRLSEAVSMGLAVVEKWVWYPGRDPADPSRDYLSLKCAGDCTFSFAKGSSFDATLIARYDVAEEPTKSKQTYGISTGLSSRLGEWQLGARYRGELRFPLGSGGLVQVSAYNTGSLTIQWDPNR